MTIRTSVRAGFRSDINGLRAWAVAAVILYHFGVPGFSGGFVGVDVFFVISGFLMTGIVIKGLERGSFSVIGFYMARGRRIVPALLVLCAVLLALGWFVLLPPDYKKLSTHSVYALTFLSNVEFWQEAGYFDVASREKWLLHTWSLSVEWQFYLILPVALWVVWRVKPGRVAQTWAVVVALVASLFASIWVTSTQPSAAFYLLHTRAWEMLAGGLVFLLAANFKLSEAQRRWMESAGLLLIVLAIAVYDKDTAWPGWRAMLPVAAAVLVLVANRSSIWTASWLPQWLGDRSYSLYLWHWPVVVALVYFDLHDNSMAITAAIFLTALLGHISYVGVENTSRRLLERQRVFPAGAGLTLAIAVVTMPAVGIWKWQGVLGRFAPAVEVASAEAQNTNSQNMKCFLDNGYISPSCVVGAQNWSVIAVGDSHVNAVISALAEAGKSRDAGVLWWAYSGCPYVPGLKLSPIGTLAKRGTTYQCPEFLDWTQKQLANAPKNVPVVIINRYGLAAFGYNENSPVREVPDVYFSKHYSSPTPEFLAEFAKHVTDEACKLAKQRTVFMMRPIPEMGFDVPKTLSRRMASGLNSDLSIPIEEYQKRNAWVWAAQDAARDQCGIKILDPTPYLCRDGRCYGSKAGRPLYSDDDHLSEYGNKLLVPMFAEVFRAL
jgi:peptidoglycan/LPS O-acetylase OafA/YrhL